MRNLKPEETPKVGDVFKMFDGPFGTAIVTKVHPDESVDVERPMMHITGPVPGPAITVERILNISAHNIRQFKFYMFRDGIDNRWYDEQARRVASAISLPRRCPDCGCRCDCVHMKQVKHKVLLQGSIDTLSTDEAE